MQLLKALIGLSCWLLSTALVWANSLEDIRVQPASNETRVVIDLAEKPNYTYFTITEAKPFRLVIDLPNTKLSTALPQKFNNNKILTKIRKSRPIEKGSFRLVFELKKEIEPLLFQLPPSAGFAHRLVVNLPHDAMPITSSIEVQEEKVPTEVATEVTYVAEPEVIKLEPTAEPKTTALMTDPTAELETTVKTEPEAIAKEGFAEPEPTIETALPFGRDDIVIAIDPGHGGIDPGAVGPQRKYEKHITLSIAQQMAKLINSIRGMKAVLTRDGDYFVDLNKRSDIARRFGAHFLISIHADGFHQPEPRGASVWVLSKTRANSEIGRWIERHEKQSELLGGGSVLQQYQDENLSRALLDLQFNNSHKEGYNVAIEVLRELGKVTHLHKSSPEYASLAVLKAPDIPSILVEAGFITNPEEEILLLTDAYQEKIAKAVYLGVKSYFEQFPPDGTLFAAMKNGIITHKVQYGESLSAIAEKYGTSVEDIMRNNDLSSEMLKASQELIIYDEKSEGTDTQALSDWTQHIVKDGEYLGKIAGNYGVTIEQIRNVNSLGSDVLEIGQILIIPGS